MNVANGDGATVRADINDHLGALVTISSGATAPGTPFAGMLWYDTANNQVKRRNQANTAWIVVLDSDETNDENIPRSRSSPVDFKEQSMSDGDTTPDVSGSFSWNDVGWTGAGTITAFDGGVNGHWFDLRITTSHVTIDGGLTGSGHSIPCQSGDWLRFKYNGSAYEQVAGNVGMGTTLVIVEPGDTIGDWIATTQITFTDVDVSDDGVRKGAVAFHLAISIAGPASGMNSCRARQNGSTSDTSGEIVNHQETSGANNLIGHKWVPLDEDAIFEARFQTSAASAAENAAFVIAYII